MPSSFRILGRWLLASVLCLLGAKAAQRPQNAPVRFSTLSLAADGVRGLFYDCDSKRIALDAGVAFLSRAYTAPEGGVLNIYRLVPPVPPATNPAKIPVATVTLAAPGPWLLLFSGSADGRVNVRAIDDSWAKNPLLSSRLINAARRKIAVQVDDSMAELAPGESRAFPPPRKASGVVGLKVATLDNGRWTMRSLTPRGLYPRTRNIFIIEEQPPTREVPHPVDVDIYAIVDATQPPAPPKKK